MARPARSMGVLLTVVALLLAVAAPGAAAAPYYVAGTAAGTSAALLNPDAVAVLPGGALVVADTADRVVKEIAPDGSVATVAGTGEDCDKPPCTGPDATHVPLGRVYGIAAAADGRVYVTTNDNLVVSFTVGGGVTAVAGDGNVCDDPADACGDGGPGAAAQFASPTGLALSRDGNVLYVADDGDARVRAVATGANHPVSAVGGAFSDPHALAVGPDGALYVADRGTQTVSRIDSSGVHAFAGGGSCSDGCGTIPATQVSFTGPNGLALDPGGGVLVADGYYVWDVATDGTAQVVAGSSGFCFDDDVGCGDGGAATSATFGDAEGLAAGAGGVVLVADAAANRVRSLTPGIAPPPPPAGTGGGTLPEPPAPPTPSPSPSPLKPPVRTPAAPGSRAHPLCSGTPPGVSCSPGGGRRSKGGAGTGNVSHRGWPAIGGVLMQADNDGRRFSGTSRSDELLGGHGSDRISGGAGGDVMWGDKNPTGNDTSQHDTLYGGAGRDFIYTSHGHNVVFAGSGNDVVHAYYGHGIVNCGAGRDVVWVPRNPSFRHYELIGCEHLALQ